VRNSHASFLHNSRLIAGLRGVELNWLRHTNTCPSSRIVVSRRIVKVQGNLSRWRDAGKKVSLSLRTPWSHVECGGLSLLIVTLDTGRRGEDSFTPPGACWIRGFLGPRADWAAMRERKISRPCRDLKNLLVVPVRSLVTTPTVLLRLMIVALT
jgi:hypothetical protein